MPQQTPRTHRRRDPDLIIVWRYAAVIAIIGAFAVWLGWVSA